MESQVPYSNVGVADVNTLPSKIEVILKPAGNAPLFSTNKWSIDKTKTIAFVLKFVRKYAQLKNNDTLYLYVKEAFI
ncbi:hypothetical protein MXB_3563, partial [Myxobolus squamalis]